MTKLTEMETRVLKAWPSGYDCAEYLKDDLGASWTNAEYLSEKTGLDIKSVKGVLGSLSSKGLIYVDEGGMGNPIQCLSEDGADAHFQVKTDAVVKYQLLLISGPASLSPNRWVCDGSDDPIEPVQFTTRMDAVETGMKYLDLGQSAVEVAEMVNGQTMKAWRFRRSN
jgi:hypothetical protein